MNNPLIKHKGLWPVMLTPLKHNKEIDYYSLEQLTAFYLDNGAAGLFANCLSSEMYELSNDERLSIIEVVVNRTQGKVPVAATGTFGGALDNQAEFIKKVYDQGVNVVVLISSQLVNEQQGELQLKTEIYKIMELTREIPLGLYECPLPYKRLISPGLARDLALSGRFLYLKDTTCDMGLLKPKILAVAGTSLAVFNANTPTALNSLRAGADGLSPISANFYPELYSWLFNNFENEKKSEMVEYLNDQLIMMDAITRINYPMSAKVFLAKRDLNIEPEIRTQGSTLNFEEMIILEKLHSNYIKIINELSINTN